MTKDTSTVNIRELALGILLSVLEENQTSSDVIHSVLEKYQYLPKQDRAFLSRLCEGTIERKIELDYIINQFSSVKTRKMKPVIRTILRMGTYQIKYMNQVPQSAACNESVKLSTKKGFHNLKGFVNGVLRNIARNYETITYPDKNKNKVEYYSVVYSMPEWIVEKWLQKYPEDEVEEMLIAFTKEKHTNIRVNTSKISVEKMKELLMQEVIEVEEGVYLDNALKIRGYNYINKVPGFKEGYFAVQDESSMLAVVAAGIEPGMEVIDVCAAPGGKSMFAAELLQGKGHILSCDVKDSKVEKIRHNSERFQISNLETKVWDATILDDSLIESMDVVIADVPCSGLGVIGKKPDIKYNCSQAGIDQLVEIQRNILDVASQYVKPGGVLLFSTCTVTEEENVNNARWFSEKAEFDFENLTPYLPENLKIETAKEGFVQLLPGVHNTDGFFIARFRKRG